MIGTEDLPRTEKEALETALEHWEWMRQNPLRLKCDWPKMAAFCRVPLNSCFLCELFFNDARCYSNIGVCPLAANEPCWLPSHPYSVFMAERSEEAPSLKKLVLAIDALIEMMEVRYAEIEEEERYGH